MMISTQQRPVCKTPDLCVIACPYNRILTDQPEPSCELPSPLLDGEDYPIEIVFRDPPAAEESQSQ